MPKSPTTSRDELAPRMADPFKKQDNVLIHSIDFAKLDIGSPKDIMAPDSAHLKESKANPTVRSDVPDATTPRLLAPPSRLVTSSTNVNESGYWSLKGDFIRAGIHVYSKSGKHVIEDPLADNLPKPPRWLQVQLNVVVGEESYWNCDIVLKDMGGLPCGKDVLIAVQSGGVSADLQKGKYTLFLKPPADDEDPRIAISYFIPYSAKHYVQAMDGQLPYGFLLQRVSGKAEQKAKKRRTSRWREKRHNLVSAITGN